ncbi:hypothetical protein LJW66_002514 [Salmonella enterica]|nr:hypothetical protein [Salmonella enterica]EIK1900934.1 hypothetical protein [Salmonella enterica]
MSPTVFAARSKRPRAPIAASGEKFFYAVAGTRVLGARRSTLAFSRVVPENIMPLVIGQV